MLKKSSACLMVFDGLCNLCSAGARWVQRHRIEPPFRLVVDGDRCLTQSDAWIHLVAAAGGGWRLIHATRVIPQANDKH